MHKLDTRIYARMHCMVHVLCVCTYVYRWIHKKSDDVENTRQCSYTHVYVCTVGIHTYVSIAHIQ